jgi:F-type H+-transporting ATPase subunit d
VVELKEAEKSSLKESERIEKEIVELKEMKVRRIFTGTELHYLEKKEIAFPFMFCNILPSTL